MLAKSDIEKYFVAEKQESLFITCVGILAVALAMIGLFVFKTQFWKGAAIPLIAIGLVQIIVGINVYRRSDADRIRVMYAYDMDRTVLKEKELPRMVIVDKNFGVYRWFQIMLLIVGFVLVFYNKTFMDRESSFENMKESYKVGVGVALIIQSIILLSADYFAEKRVHLYTEQLKQFVKK